MGEKMRIEMITIDQVVPNSWNPNVMDDETFNRLATEIAETGYIDPIQVVEMEDGRYTIIGGEHRWRAMRALGHEQLECVVLTGDKWKDVDLQKFVTMRLNAIHGEVNPEKFMKLYQDLSDRYEEESLQALMGVTDADAWKHMTKGLRKDLKDSGLNDEALKHFDEVTKEIRTVDDLSVILNGLFTEYGDTLEYNFMYFTFGSKEHLYVQCSKETWKKVKAMIDCTKKKKLDASVVFGNLLEDWESVVATSEDADAAE